MDVDNQSSCGTSMEEMDMIDGEEGEERDELVEEERNERREMRRGNKRMKTSIDEYTAKVQYSINQNSTPLSHPFPLPFPLPSPVPTHTPTFTHPPTPSSTPPLPSTPSFPHEDSADRFRGIVFFDGLGDIVDVQAPLLKFQVIILMISYIVLMILLPRLKTDLHFI